MTSPGLSALDIARALGQPRPTSQQQQIIEHPPTPLLVVAGAGSGKTETMSARVVWLVANGHAQPEEVLGLTFTRKAAAELAGRVTARLRSLADAGLWRPDEATDLLSAPPTVSTYHAYAARLVRDHALRLGREPDARLRSEAAAWQLAQEVVTQFDGPLEDLGKAESTMTAAVVDLAGEMSEHLVTAEQLEAWLVGIRAHLEGLAAGAGLQAAGKALHEAMAGKLALLPVVRRYAETKRDRGAMDFSDQMALAATLAGRFPEVGRLERERYRAVLLDEFQDTSHAQLELLSALFATGDGPHCVTAVGDPNQSIYAWRGASAATLALFPKAFGPKGSPDPGSVDLPPVPVLPLSVTWRNAQNILDLANAVAEPLRRHAAVPVEPLAAAPDAPQGRIDIARVPTTADEATLVARWIAQRRAEGAQSAAVLARKRSQFDVIVAALEAEGLPVEVVGLGGLLVTPEVGDVVALLSVAHDAARGDRLMRLLTGPVCRLGAADLTALQAWARRHQHPASRRGPGSRGSDLSDAAADRVSLVEAVTDLPRLNASERLTTGISPTGLDRLGSLAVALSTLRSVSGGGLVDMVAEAERALGLDIEVLSRTGYPPGVARAHLDAFEDVAAQFALSGDRPTLGGFLAWLDAALQEERGLDKGILDIAPGAVHVLTVHAAKGLEWDAVAIPGLIESTFPAHSGSVSSLDKDTGRWKVNEPNDSAWTVGLGTLPYDLRGDRASLTALAWRSATDGKDLEKRLREFKAAAGQAGIAEERRLAYVAFTRARHSMLLTAPVWGSAKTPRVPSRFLREVREVRPDLLTVLQWEDDPAVDAPNPLLAEPVTAPWPLPSVGDPGVRVGAAFVDDALAAPERQDALDPAVEVLLAERAARASGAETFAARSGSAGSWRVLDALGGHVSTSQLVALAQDPEVFAENIRRPMPTRPSPATRRGTAFHAWIERHYRRASLLEPDDLPGSADDPLDAGGDLAELTARFLASEWASQEPVEVEVMVETVIAGAAVRGRIDAVFPTPEGVVIVDWKSGHPPSGEAAHAAAVQLAAYRIAYARLRGLDVRNVDAAFYYAATGQTRKPALRDEAELSALVATLQP